MKKKSIIYFAIFLFGGIVLLTSNTLAQQVKPKNEEMQKQETIYTCPMHPEVVQNEPGKCPKCGMELVIKKDKQMKMMQHIQSDSVNMKHHGQMMHDSTIMHHEYMMKDSSMMKHDHKMK